MSRGSSIIQDSQDSVSVVDVSTYSNASANFESGAERQRLEALEKRNGEWRISKRTYVLDWSHQFPDALKEATGPDFDLNVLHITKSGHPMYRKL